MLGSVKENGKQDSNMELEKSKEISGRFFSTTQVALNFSSVQDSCSCRRKTIYWFLNFDSKIRMYMKETNFVQLCAVNCLYVYLYVKKCINKKKRKI